MIAEDGGVLRAHSFWSDAVLATLARSERLALSIDPGARSVRSRR
jgi:hypothetical protein